MSRGKWVTLKLHQLRLDELNYRLGPQLTQRDAIRAMIEDQGNKLVRIAKDILQMKGVSPGEPIWVVPALTRGQYIVEEGNRRITALKILETPALADGTNISRQFRLLSKKYAENPIRELDARLFETREHVLPWKRRRHMTAASGVGLAPWKTLAKGRANRDMGLDAPRSLAVVEFFSDDRSDLWAEILEALDGRWTTVDRVFNAGPFKDTLGINIDPKTSIISFENGDEQAGKDLLKRILTAMATPDFEFADVEDKDDRRKFIERFSAYNVKLSGDQVIYKTTAPDSSQTGLEFKTPSDERAAGHSDATPTAPKPRTQSPAGSPSTLSGRRETTDGKRKTLAPADGPRILPVQGVRLASLYSECRRIKVKNNENSAAFLVRVFVELSSEEFLETKNVIIPRSLRDRNITSWSDYKVKLSDKITAVALHIDPTEKSPIFVQSRMAIKQDAVGPYSVKMLHSYFHNYHILPDEDTIKASWDGWESYLKALHNALVEN